MLIYITCLKDFPDSRDLLGLSPSLPVPLEVPGVPTWAFSGRGFPKNHAAPRRGSAPYLRGALHREVTGETPVKHWWSGENPVKTLVK